MPLNNLPQDGPSSFDEFLARYLQGERARAARSIDVGRFLGARTQELLQRAGRFALQRGQHELDALHVLRVLVDDVTVGEAVARIGGDPAAPRRSGCRARARLPTPMSPR
jgi:ATP-dependent Clp protease ATP-binding subunit ClpC